MTTPQDPFSTPPGGSTPPPSPPPGHGQDGRFGESGGYGVAPVQQGHQNGLGTAALVLGILGALTAWFVIGALLGVVAIILGALALGKVKRREASNRGSAIAGIVLGVISLLLLGVAVAAGLAFFNSDAGQRLVECTQQAGQDQAAVAECQREFEESVQQG